MVPFTPGASVALEAGYQADATSAVTFETAPVRRMMDKFLTMDAGKVIILAVSVVGLISVIVTVRAVTRANLRRACSAALAGAACITIAAIGATWLGLDALRALAG